MPRNTSSLGILDALSVWIPAQEVQGRQDEAEEAAASRPGLQRLQSAAKRQLRSITEASYRACSFGQKKCGLRNLTIKTGDPGAFVAVPK